MASVAPAMLPLRAMPVSGSRPLAPPPPQRSSPSAPLPASGASSTFAPLLCLRAASRTRTARRGARTVRALDTRADASGPAQAERKEPPAAAEGNSARAVPDPAAAREADAAGGVRRKRPSDSTDWIASGLSRRFGIGAGLAWVAFLAFGVVSEQVKTRFEVYNEEKNTRDVAEAEEIALPDGVHYRDLRQGGGSSPFRGDLVLVSLTGRVPATGAPPFIDTAAPGARDVVFAFGARPYIGGVCEGLEEAMLSMKVGGRRQVSVPPERGYGAQGADFGTGHVVPPGATLEYVVELKRASIAPS